MTEKAHPGPAITYTRNVRGQHSLEPAWPERYRYRCQPTPDRGVAAFGLDPRPQDEFSDVLAADQDRPLLDGVLLAGCFRSEGAPQLCREAELAEAPL